LVGIADISNSSAIHTFTKLATAHYLLPSRSFVRVKERFDNDIHCSSK